MQWLLYLLWVVPRYTFLLIQPHYWLAEYFSRYKSVPVLPMSHFSPVSPTVPAGTCSRNMFSVNTISSSMNDVLKSRVPARTVPAGTRSNHVLRTNRPLSTHPKQVWTLCYREQCSKWAGLSTQTAISTESAHWNDLARCAVYTQ